MVISSIISFFHSLTQVSTTLYTSFVSILPLLSLSKKLITSGKNGLGVTLGFSVIVKEVEVLVSGIGLIISN